MPGLREYVKTFYPLGPLWGPVGSPACLSASNTSKGKCAAQAPAAPPPPLQCLFGSEATPSQPKTGMSAVFQEISSGKSVTAGNPLKHSLKSLMNISSEVFNKAVSQV